MSNKFNTDVQEIDPNRVKAALASGGVPSGELTELAGEEPPPGLAILADQLEAFAECCGTMSTSFEELRTKLLGGMSLEALREEVTTAHPAMQEMAVSLNIFLEAIGVEVPDAGMPSQTEEAVEKGTGENFKTGMAIELAEKFGMPVVKAPPYTQEESEDAMRDFLSGAVGVGAYHLRKRGKEA